jgi:hypothetical protein
MGRKLYKTNVFRSVASFEEQASLTNGQIVNRPYRSNVVVENYVRGTALTAQDLTATSDQLTVNVFKGLLMYVDEIDKVQNKWSAAKLWAEEAAIRLANAIDAEFFSRYQDAASANLLDDGKLGGTSGNGLTLTTANILSVFGVTNRLLDVQNVPLGSRFFAISPQFKQKLWEYISGRESILGDKTGENGNIGSYAGFDLYLTNNLTGSANFTAAAATPTAADTVTINGVVFTAQSTIGVAAGNVYIGANSTAFLTNLKALIDAGGVGDGTNNVSLALADQRTVQTWFTSAVTSSTLTVSAKGASYMAVSASMTNTANTWTAAKQVQHCLAGMKQSIDLVIQKEPDVEMASTVAAGKRGMNILPMTIFGVKTFNQGANQIVDVQINSSVF